MNIIRFSIDKLQSHLLRKKGYSKYYVSNLKGRVRNAYLKSDLPKDQKKWAYERGFYPWRIRQYNLNEDNYRNIISDEDYFYLYPLNNEYRKWIDDKLTMRYILEPFHEFLPKYYFHIMKNREVMRLADCPQTYGSSIKSISEMLQQEKLLVAKKATGTHGVGFYKLEYSEDGTFLVNKKKYSENDFQKFLSDLDDYVITEYVQMHPEISKFYSGSVNTIRVTLINENGNDPVIPVAYFRIGTSKSGVVDNIAQGGIVCKIDIESGRFYDSQIPINHVYEKVIKHPDSNLELTGTIPNWKLIKEGLLKIAEYCPQLAWLGFDIAVTEDGFKIIEINSHQELHKAHEYPSEVTDYLFRALNKKKKKYHIKQKVK